ncbi:MAG: alpha/beta hydrolase [Candidatus Omnitrophica bacterium]|nr:alpha/beta hydrolase [Candidatus Omnitrophota bacterium]
MSLSTFLAGCALDHRYVYFPEKWQAADWGKQQNLPIEDVWFEASDGVRLHGWIVKAPESQLFLLWCHGNAGNIIDRLQNIDELYRRGVSVFIFDYRGYGQSQGHPSEAGLYKDAQAAYDFLTQTRHVLPERIVLFGRSLGAAVAAELASQRRVAGLILETPFPSVPAMVKAYYGWLPLHLLLQARYDLGSRLKDVRVPVLVLHGDRDTIVPLALGRQVYEAANDPKGFYLIRGANHNDTYLVGGEPYFQRLLSFLHQVQPSGQNS